MENRTEETNIYYVSIKALEFMETAINGLFSILEVQFCLWNGMISETKFFTLIASLLKYRVTTGCKQNWS